MTSGVYKRTDLMKKTMSIVKTGSKHSQETKEKIKKSWDIRGRVIKGNNKSKKEYLRNQRIAALEILGGICCKCGFSDRRALQIDHINGGGSKERKERNYKGSFHKNVINSVLNKENKYQLLCANCNWIKRYENNEDKINN